MSNIETIDAKQANDLLNKGEAIIVDVREPDEFAEEHIKLAVSIPLSNFADTLPNFNNNNMKIIFQCASGNRSGKACEIAKVKLQQNHKIYSLYGGLAEWKKNGLETVIMKNSVKLPLMRQVHIVAGALITLSVLSGFIGFPLGYVLAGVFGFSLMISGITGWCTMAKILAKMPWNN